MLFFGTFHPSTLERISRWNEQCFSRSDLELSSMLMPELWRRRHGLLLAGELQSLFSYWISERDD